MLRLSTALRNAILDGTTGFKGGVSGGFLDLWSGGQPASSDDIATGTLLCRLYAGGVAGTGLTLGASASGVIAKTVAEVWQGVGLATGSIGWFRYYDFVTDAATSYTTGAAASTTQGRLDGSVSTSGADMNLSSVSVVSGATVTLDTFQLTMPAS